MAKYFNVAHGLRGFYDYSDTYVVKVTTRRELRAIVENEVRSYTDGGYVGGNQRAISAIAVRAWKEAHVKRPAYLPFCLPLAPSHNRKSYSFGVFVSVASRADYVAHCKAEDMLS